MIMTNCIGLRVITNLHCNSNCSFCYQQNKSNKVLPVEQLLEAVKPYGYKQFEYCTIMGGESTVLKPSDLYQYIRIGSTFSKQTRMTTNGKLLTHDYVHLLKSAGLDGINVSFAVLDEEKYLKVHGSHCNIDYLLGIIDERYLDFRINIPLCKENMENDCEELKHMLNLIVKEGHHNVTMCEDIKGTYSLYENFEKIGCKEVGRTDYGLIFLEYAGEKIGYYTHRNNNYNDTDLVVTPVGNFINWDGYCKEVGLTI